MTKTENCWKYGDLVASNNLGLDASAIDAVLGAAAKKGQSWNNPEAVLDALQRASDRRFSGLTISHKKFPTPGDGTDSYVLRNAKQYQKEASGDANLSFDLGNVSFDDLAADGKLIDRKFGHGSSIFNADGTVHNQARANSILDQIRKQLEAVEGDGAKLRWEVSTTLGADGIEQLFIDNAARFP